MSNELRACPFCGRNASTRFVSAGMRGTNCYNQWWEAFCISCEAHLGWRGSFGIPRTDTEKEAIEKWNTRAPVTVSAAWDGWQASERRLMEMLESKEFREDLGVAIAEAYVLIPKGMPWESASEKLEEAAIAAIQRKLTINQGE